MKNISIKIPGKYKPYLLLLLLPVFIFFTTGILRDARGPYWLGTNSDPEYAYLLNSLNVATLQTPGHTDHPGTTVQVLGAGILRISYFFKQHKEKNLQLSVLSDPEYYLTNINKFFITMICLIVTAVGFLIFYHTGNIFLSFIVQASPFLSPAIINYSLTRVSPEPLLLFTSLCLIFTTISFLYKRVNSKQEKYYFLFFACIAGFGLATKVTFISLVILPLLLLRSIKNSLYYLLSTILFFVLFTISIIPAYSDLFEWLFKLTTHTGSYGSGSKGFAELSSYFINISHLLKTSPVFKIILTVSIITIILSILIKKIRAFSLKEIHFKTLITVTITQFIGLVISSKYNSSHYLIPVLCLSSLNIYLLICYLKDLSSFFKFKDISILCSLVIFLLISYQAVISIKNIYKKRLPVKNELLNIHHLTENKFTSYAKIHYYRCSSPQYALRFGNSYAANSYSKILKELYPNVFSYCIWNKRFYTWEKNIKLKDIIAKYGNKIILQGSPFHKKHQKYQPDFKYKDILKGQNETIYFVER